jgi:general stress protein CsbA
MPVKSGSFFSPSLSSWWKLADLFLRLSVALFVLSAIFFMIPSLLVTLDDRLTWDKYSGEVVNVSAASPATEVGIRQRDRILAVDGFSIATRVAQSRYQRRQRGLLLPLTIERDGQLLEIALRPSSPPWSFRFFQLEIFLMSLLFWGTGIRAWYRHPTHRLTPLFGWLGQVTAGMLAASELISIHWLWQLTEADLEQFVGLAFEDRITVPQAEAFLNKLNAKQDEMVTDLIGIKADIPLDEWRKEIGEHRQDKQQTSERNLGSQAPLGGWAQPIENIWTWLFPPGSTWANSHYVDDNCDSDPTDSEYVFDYNMDASNPEGLRWTSTSTHVYLVFRQAYGLVLGGLGDNANDAKLCIGYWTVWLAGGPWKVRLHVFMHPN